MQLYPHEVADVQPVLDLLSRQDPKDSEVRLALFFMGKNNIPVLHSKHTFVHFLPTNLVCIIFGVRFTSGMFYNVLIPDLGNSLHAVVVAVHDLPHTL